MKTIDSIHFYLIRTFMFLFFFMVFRTGSAAENNPAKITVQKIDKLSTEINDSVISWRRDIHEHPELGNREFSTAALVADHLKRLGLDVGVNVAHTGVVGILKGKKEGPVIALRADMDALPIKELADVPFASVVTTEYNGETVPVMHACGHDAHVAILMGVASVLSELKDELQGTVKFIFQPAEDSKPDGEEGGAGLMIREGVLKNPDVGAIVGLHVVPYPASSLSYRPGGIYASVDNFRIKIKGRQAHGAFPWAGVDPVVTASQVVLALQTIVSRQVDLTEAPAVITSGSIHGGNQPNIIPGEVIITGTIRTFSASARSTIADRIRQTAENIAESAGAKAFVEIYKGVPPVENDEKLTALFAPVLEQVAGKGKCFITRPITVGDDFSEFTEKVPGFYFLLGTAPEGADPNKIINHSPFFIIDETALVKGVQALSRIAVEFLESGNKSGI
jgi:amidohydrolase